MVLDCRYFSTLVTTPESAHDSVSVRRLPVVNYPQLQITPSTMEMILLLIVSIIIPTTHLIILLLTRFSAGDWI